jgi:Secretion system C-terminal sorting domain
MNRTLLLLLTFFYFVSLSGQITTPAIKANFGIDADLRANYFNGFVSSGNDDWYNNGTLGPGKFIIDTTGAAAIVAAYNSNPASRMLSFSRLMKQAPYSVVNNRLLLDAVFNRDHHGDDSTVFASGSNKNGDSPVNWSCPISQGIPDKNDILDVFAHARRDGPNVTDSLWLFGGVSIENTNGNRYFDFEMYQTDLYYDRPTRKFVNYGPDAGHTAWLFDAAGNVTKPGDIIFTAEYSSSSLTLVEARIWINKSSLLITPGAFKWGGQFDGASASATFGYASILPKTAGVFYTGLQSGSNVWTGPFSLVRTDNSLAASYLAGQFMEFSINLSKLGLDPATFGGDACGTPFRRVLVKSRASTSFTSELKDFVAPFRMFDFPKARAVADVPLYCGTIGVSVISVFNPLSTSTYTWTTPDGIILSGTTGPSIIVNAPGKYIVTQKLNAACSVYAKDTVTIVFDANCIPLKNSLLEFTGSLYNQQTKLNWKIADSKLIKQFEVEYSMDNILFEKYTTVNSDGSSSVKTYSAVHDISGIKNPAIFYRLKITAAGGKVNYSNVIRIDISAINKSGISIFPNPVKNQTQLSVSSSTGQQAIINLLDLSGKIYRSFTASLQKGTNVINLKDISGYSKGVYIIRVKAGEQVFTEKMILIK